MNRFQKLFSSLFVFILFSLSLPAFNPIYAEVTCTMSVPPSIKAGDSFKVQYSVQGINDIVQSVTFTSHGEATGYTKSVDKSGTNVKRDNTTKQHTATISLSTKESLNTVPPVSNTEGETYTITGSASYPSPSFKKSITTIGGLIGNDQDTVACQASGTITVNPPETPNPSITPRPTLTEEQKAQQSQGPHFTITAHQFNGSTQPGKVDGNTSYVTIQFDGLSEGPFDVCLKTNQQGCINGNQYAKSIKNNKQNNTPQDGSLKIEPLCNNGDGNDLQVVSIKDGDPLSCKNNYFNEGQNYAVGLYTDASVVSLASFYTYHVFPTVRVGDIDISHFAENPPDSSESSNQPINNPITVSISNTIKAGGAQRNNYAILLESSNYSNMKPKCPALNGTIGDEGNASTSFSYSDFIGGTNSEVPGGNYTLTISEGVNDDNPSSCDGGFVYYSVPIQVDTSGKATINLNQIQKDPNNEETLGQTDSNILPPPCLSPSPLVGSENCDQLDTALGPINTNPLQLMGSLMTYILSISGAIILLQLIYSGYQILLSRGDKEKINAARQRITSSIIGFVFIVLSLVILQIIGVTILNIPGFKP